MAGNPVFGGKVEKGRIVWDEPEKRAVYIATLEGKRISEPLGKEVTHRTTQQNKYYWAVVLEVFGNHLGYEPEELHEAMKIKFASKFLDNGLQITESTAKMDTAKFTDYIEQIKRYAALEHGCYIPDAGEIEGN